MALHLKIKAGMGMVLTSDDGKVTRIEFYTRPNARRELRAAVVCDPDVKIRRFPCQESRDRGPGFVPSPVPVPEKGAKP
jgi:hypothetical protein